MLFETLIIVYFILFAILSWRKLDWALYLLIFALPGYLIRFSVFGIPMTLLEGMILIVFASWGFEKIIKRKFNVRSGVDANFQFSIFNFQTLKYFGLPIVLFIVASTISLFTAPDLRAAAGIWKAYIIEPILLFVVILDTVRTPKRYKNVVWALGVSILVPGIVAIIQKFTGLWIPNEFWQAEATRRVTSIYGYPNAIGLYFAPITSLIIGFLALKINTQWRTNIKSSLVLGLLAVIGLLGILFAESKGAILGIGVAILFYALFWKGLRMWFVGLLLAGIVAGFSLFPGVFDIDGTKTVSGGGSLEIRLQQWKETKELIKTRPILGAGLAGYQSRVAPFHEKDYIEIYLYPHNIFLNFWVETGLLGLMAIIWLIVLFYALLFKNRNGKPIGLRSISRNLTTYNIPVAAAMTTLIVHGLVDVPYFKNDLSVLFWIIVGLLIVALNMNISDRYGRFTL